MKNFGFITFLVIMSLLSFSCQKSKSSQEESTGIDLVNRWITVINENRNADLFNDYLAKDYILHLPGKNVFGLDSVIKVFANAFSDAPDSKLKAENIIVAEGKVVVRWAITGTDKTTGEKWSSSSITIDRFGDSKFIEGWEIGSDLPFVK